MTAARCRAACMDTISEYIDFSNNEELWKGAECMEGLGKIILEEGMTQGRKEGIEQGINENTKTQNQLIVKFSLSEDTVREYMDKFWKYNP